MKKTCGTCRHLKLTGYLSGKCLCKQAYGKKCMPGDWRGWESKTKQEAAK